MGFHQRFKLARALRPIDVDNNKPITGCDPYV
jgi:hypothetical protein